MKQKLDELAIGYYAGIACALAVMKRHGSDVLFDEIVCSVDQIALISEARRRGVMRCSGLADYVRRKKKSAEAA